MQRNHLKSSLRTRKGFLSLNLVKIHKESYYFAKEPIRYITHNIIKLPILGKIRITQNYDLPNIEDVISGRVIREYNKYYIMLIYEYNNEYLDVNDNSLGIDLGLKYYCTIANRVVMIYVQLVLSILKITLTIRK